MNKIKPIWLRNWSVPSDDTGNRKLLIFGKKNPKKDGPNIIPAKISPITIGCPIFLNNIPTIRAKVIITIICKIKIARGSERLLSKDLKKTWKLLTLVKLIWSQQRPLQICRLL